MKSPQRWMRRARNCWPCAAARINCYLRRCCIWMGSRNGAMWGLRGLTMRGFSDSYLEDYLARTWPGIGNSVGGYKLEEEGVRLFAQIQGDYFTILGLPLLELLNYLALRGEIAG
jgi:hypothetical protein